MLLEFNLTRGIREDPMMVPRCRRWSKFRPKRRQLEHLCAKVVVDAALTWLQNALRSCKHQNCYCQGIQCPPLCQVWRESLGMAWPDLSAAFDTGSHCPHLYNTVHLASRTLSLLVLQLPGWLLLLSLCCLISPLIFLHWSTPGPVLPSSLPELSTLTPEMTSSYLMT